MTEFRVTGVKAGYHTGESLSTKGGGEGERWRGGEGRGGEGGLCGWVGGGWSVEPWGHRRAAEDIGPPICPSVSEETGRTIGSPFQKTTVTNSFPTGEGKICRRELRLPDEFEGWEELQEGEGGEK